MRRLAVYSDYICPFCYLAWPALKELVVRGWEVELRAFELAPAPLPLARRPGVEQRQEWERVIAPRAASLGLEPQLPEVQPRTRKAHELAHHARALGVAGAAHEVLLDAYYRRGLDIGRIDVLVQLGEELGLERSSVKVELDIDQYADAVAGERLQAIELGVSAVPAYLATGKIQRLHVGLLDATQLAGWLAGGEPGSTEGCPVQTHRKQVAER